MAETKTLSGGVFQRPTESSAIHLDADRFLERQEQERLHQHQQDGVPAMDAVMPSWFQATGDRIDAVSVYKSAIVRPIEIAKARREGAPLSGDEEQIYNRLEREGLLPYMDDQDLMQMALSQTREELDLRINNFINRTMSQSQIQDMHWFKGLTAEMAAYGVDPITLGVDFAFGATSRGTAMARFFQAGSRSAAANALVEATLTLDDRAVRPGEIGFAAAAGFGFGGMMGAAFGRRPQRVVPDTEQGVVSDARAVDMHPDLPSDVQSAIPAYFYDSPIAVDYDYPLPIRQFMQDNLPAPVSPRRTPFESIADEAPVAQRQDSDEEYRGLEQQASLKLNERQLKRTRSRIERINQRLQETEFQEAPPWEKARAAWQDQEVRRVQEREELVRQLEQETQRLRQHDEGVQATEQLRSTRRQPIQPRRSEVHLDEIEDWVVAESRRVEDFQRSRLTTALDSARDPAPDDVPSAIRRPAEEPPRQEVPQAIRRPEPDEEPSEPRLSDQEIARSRARIDELEQQLRDSERLDPEAVDAELEGLRERHQFSESEADRWEREAMSLAEDRRLAHREQLEQELEAERIRLRGEDSSVGAAEALDVELMHDTAYGLSREYADEIVDSLGPDIHPGHVSIGHQILGSMTPATRAWITENPHIRALTVQMYTQPFTRQGQSTNVTGWEDRARRQFQSAEVLRRREHRKAFKDWLADVYGRSGLRALWQFDAESEFASEVGKAMQTLRSGHTPDVHPAIMRAAKAMDEFGEYHWAHMQRSGAVPMDMPRPYKWYIPQIVDRSKVGAFMHRFRDPGDGLVMLKRLYRKAIDPKLRAELEDLIDTAQVGSTAEGRKLINDLTDSLGDVISVALARRAYSDNTPTEGLAEMDAYGIHLGNVKQMRELLHENLVQRNANAEEAAEYASQINDLMNSLTSKRKKYEGSLPDRLRGRIDLDMDATITFQKGRTHWSVRDDHLPVEQQTIPEPHQETIRLGDLYDTNVDRLAHNYGRWAAAESAVAQTGESLGNIQRAIKELKEEAGRKGEYRSPDAPSASDIDAVEYAYRALMNLPAHDVKEHVMRGSNALKNLAYVAKMGSAFSHIFSESYTTMAQHGIIPTLREIPTLMRVLGQYARGEIDPGLHADFYNMNASMANSFEITMGGSRFDTDLASDAGPGSNAPLRERVMVPFERFSEGAKRVASYVNLMPVTTDVARQFNTYMALKQLDQAVRGQQMPSYWDGMRRQYGLSDAGLERIRRHFLSEHVSRNADGELDWDGSLGLEYMPAETRIELENYLYRNTSTAIQEIHRGNLPPVMTGPVGSVLLQFRSFEVASTSRHLAADISRGDMLAYHKFVGSAMMAALGYAARVYAFSGGDQDRIEEMLQPDRVLANAVAYSVSAGVIPAVTDTIGANLAGGLTPFNRFRTTGLSDNIFANPLSPGGVGAPPVLSVFGDISRAVGTVPQLGYDMASGRGPQISREQVRAISTVVGADTMWFLRPFKEYAMNQFESERDLTRGNILTATGLSDE